jgi:hypothetical protein
MLCYNLKPRNLIWKEVLEEKERELNIIFCLVVATLKFQEKNVTGKKRMSSMYHLINGGYVLPSDNQLCLNSLNSDYYR